VIFPRYVGRNDISGLDIHSNQCYHTARNETLSFLSQAESGGGCCSAGRHVYRSLRLNDHPTTKFSGRFERQPDPRYTRQSDGDAGRIACDPDAEANLNQGGNRDGCGCGDAGGGADGRGDFNAHHEQPGRAGTGCESF
jgi:hypothetical protein